MLRGEAPPNECKKSVLVAALGHLTLFEVAKAFELGAGEKKRRSESREDGFQDASRFERGRDEREVNLFCEIAAKAFGEGL